MVMARQPIFALLVLPQTLNPFMWRVMPQHAAAADTAATSAKPLPDGWADGTLPDGQVFYYPIAAPENIQWERPDEEQAAAAEVATEAAALDLAKTGEKETLLAFREGITDPDDVLRNWDRSTDP